MAPRVPGRGMILLLVAAADMSTQCGGAGASGSVACGFAVSSRHLGLRGGEPAQDRLQKWRKKFPLGMQLYEAAGGVIPGPGDKWLPHADLLHIQALLKRGAKANFQGPGKYTPLHFAAAAGFVDVVELLLDHGADINATSKWLWTPLHLAAAQGHTEVVRKLTNRGADILARTLHTNLPLDEATGNQHWRTASLLKHLMGPDWYKWARKSYHDEPDGYTYDRIEKMTDDEVALFWQNMMRQALGPAKFGQLFDGVKDPMSAMTLEIDPDLRDEVGWVDAEGRYHAPWEAGDAEIPPSSVDDSSAFEQQSPEPAELLV